MADDGKQLQWSNLVQSGGDVESQADYEVTSPASQQHLLSAKVDVVEYKDHKQQPGGRAPDQQFTWDIVFVFKVGQKDKMVKLIEKKTKKIVEMTEEERFRNTTADMVNRFRKAGFMTDLYYSVQQDEIYCRIGAPEKRLQQEADRVNYELQLDHHKCLELGNAMDVKLAKATVKRDAGLDEEAWLNLYGPYNQLDRDHPYRQELYLRYNTEDPNHPRYNSFFTSIDRLKLSVVILESDKLVQGCDISMDRCLLDDTHSMIAWFPLHEHEKKKKLMDNWMKVSSTFNAPLNEIRAYFGEKIAYYFAFLAFYNRMLIIPALLGLGLFIWQRVEKRVDVHGAPPFAAIIAVWATLLLEIWKRKQAKYRVRWGMVHFDQQEQPRPEFKGKLLPSPVTGKLEPYFPWISKIIRMLFSQSVIWTLIGVVIASVVGIFFFRSAIQSIGAFGTYLTAFVNAVQIQILNLIYGMVSKQLNDFENHKTDTEYENALIAKSFLFKFVNSYNSLFYIAYFKKNDSSVSGCLDNDCLGELTQQLGTIFVVSIVVSNAVEVLLPRIKSYIAARQNRAEDGDAGAAGADAPANAPKHWKKKSQPEIEFELETYGSTFDDFDEIVIQYGYVTLFVVAFPLAPLAALLNNFLETRIDSQKVCSVTRRPEPRGAANIGTWFSILNILGFIAVGTNAALIAWETDVILNWIKVKQASYCVFNGGLYSPSSAIPSCPDVRFAETDGRAERAYAFIVSEHIVILLKFAIDYFVPDEPADLRDHIARNEYLVNVMLKGMEDEEEEIPSDADGQKVSLHYEATDVEFDWSCVNKELVNDDHTFKTIEDPSTETVPPNVQ